jgi:hypothetical protein
MQHHHSSIQRNRERIMTNDFRDFAEFPLRWERPGTSLGRWSLALLAGFVALMVLLMAMLSLARNDVILGCTAAAAFGSAFAAGVVAVVAIKRKGERSILMVLPLFMGGVATLVPCALIVEWLVRL